GVRNDHLEVGDALGQLRDRRPSARARLKVATHPRPQGLRLADVEDLAARPSEEVDAGLRRKRFQLLFDVLVQARARVASGHVKKALLAAGIAVVAGAGAIAAVVASSHGDTTDTAATPSTVQASIGGTTTP